MKRSILGLVVLVSLAVVAIVVSAERFNPIENVDPGTETDLAAKPRKTMRAFRSEQELKDHFRKLLEKQRNEREKSSSGVAANSPTVTLSDSAAKSKDEDKETITNNQHAGVDEGGIVKLHGDHLVILRRGRLFTVRIGDNSLRPVDAINAFAPGVDPKSDWYDEMLVSGDTVVVIGYSYGRGGTEINLFDIDAAGTLDYRSTYHLRSN